MTRLIEFFRLLFVVFLTLPLALLPLSIALRAGDLLGSFAFFFWRSRRTIALDNLQGAVDRGAITLSRSPRSVIRSNFKNLGRSFVEVIKIYYGLDGAVLRTVAIKGIEHFQRAGEKRRGVLCVTGHCGNWELLAVSVARNVARLNVVARKQENEYVNRLIERTRKRYGNSVIYKEGALKKILAALKKHETVGILMDQSAIRSEGLVIPFLGKEAYAMKTPAIIARKTGVPVISCFIRRTAKGHVIEFGQEISLDASEDNDTAVLHNTINFSRPIEEFIRKYPEDWLWIHRRWKRAKK